MSNIELGQKPISAPSISPEEYLVDITNYSLGFFLIAASILLLLGIMHSVKIRLDYKKKNITLPKQPLTAPIKQLFIGSVFVSAVVLIIGLAIHQPCDYTHYFTLLLVLLINAIFSLAIAYQLIHGGLKQSATRAYWRSIAGIGLLLYIGCALAIAAYAVPAESCIGLL